MLWKGNSSCSGPEQTSSTETNPDFNRLELEVSGDRPLGQPSLTAVESENSEAPVNYWPLTAASLQEEDEQVSLPPI